MQAGSDTACNTAPLRKIQGDRTGLNWPTGLAFDPEARELFVANDAAHEILVTGAVRDAAGPGCVFEAIARVPPGASSAFRLVRTSAAK